MLALGVVESCCDCSVEVSISSSPSSSCTKAVSASTYWSWSGDLGTMGDGALDLPACDWLAEAGTNVALTCWAMSAITTPTWAAASYLAALNNGLVVQLIGRTGSS